MYQMYVQMYMHLKCIRDLIYYVLEHSITYCTIITMWITASIYMYLSCCHLKILYANVYIHNWCFNMLNKPIIKNSLIASCRVVDWCGYTYVTHFLFPLHACVYVTSILSNQHSMPDSTIMYCSVCMVVCASVCVCCVLL